MSARPCETNGWGIWPPFPCNVSSRSELRGVGEVAGDWETEGFHPTPLHWGVGRHCPRSQTPKWVSWPQKQGQLPGSSSLAPVSFRPELGRLSPAHPTACARIVSSLRSGNLKAIPFEDTVLYFAVIQQFPDGSLVALMRWGGRLWSFHKAAGQLLVGANLLSTCHYWPRGLFGIIGVWVLCR